MDGYIKSLISQSTYKNSRMISIYSLWMTLYIVDYYFSRLAFKYIITIQMERKIEINVDNIIEKLLSVRNSKVPKQVNLL